MYGHVWSKVNTLLGRKSKTVCGHILYTVLIWTFFPCVGVGKLTSDVYPGIVCTQFDVVFDTKSLERAWSAWRHQPPLQDTHTSWHQDPSRRTRAWLTVHSEVRGHHFWKLILWFISSQSDRLQVMQLATFQRQHERRHCSEIQLYLTPAVSKCSCSRFVTGVNMLLSLCGPMPFSSQHLHAIASIL